MVNSAKNKIFNRIKRKGKGFVFSASDFLPNFKRFEIDQSFKSLQADGLIDKVITGIYYYPEYNEMLKQNAGPNINKVINAIARKNDWKIFPEGNTALNYLGLSTQIPGKYIYISDGPSHKYKIGNLDLEFRHRLQKESSIRDINTNLVVQAIKSIGTFHASQPDFVRRLSSCFKEDDWIKIEKKAIKAPYWILETIKKSKDLSHENNC